MDGDWRGMLWEGEGQGVGMDGEQEEWGVNGVVIKQILKLIA